MWVRASRRSCGDLEVLPSNNPFAACGCRQWSCIPPLLRLRTLSKLVVNQGAHGGPPWCARLQLSPCFCSNRFPVLCEIPAGHFSDCSLTATGRGGHRQNAKMSVSERGCENAEFSKRQKPKAGLGRIPPVVSIASQRHLIGGQRV